jgi:hypothetical protein
MSVNGAEPTAESIAAFAGLLADRSRVSMYLALLDGRAWTRDDPRRGGPARRAAAGPSSLSPRAVGTCYGHLADVLGAVLCRELLRRSWVARTTD